jgi:hypothetical protein
MLASFLRPLCAPAARPKGKVSSTVLAISELLRSVGKAARARRRASPVLEYLEDRTLLTVAYPSVLLMHPVAFSPLTSSSLPSGFNPAQIRHAYGFDQISLNNGTVRGDGSGQTIAIVDAYNDPNISSNLATFDSTFGFAAPPSFRVVNQSGGTALPGASASWGLEESLDVEWAHAVGPGARIVLVEANSASLTDLLSAVNYARNLSGVSVVSMSWGAGEFSGESSYNSYFTTPAGHAGVTFVASSGDSGSAGAPEWPSVASDVLAVGGTQLTLNASGNYSSETAWSGSGGGVSAYETQPSFQKGVVTQSTTKRTVPDVAYDGSGGSPFAVYDSYGYSGWVEVYGTSAGAPQWAGLVAIADQGRALAGKSSLDGATQTLPAIYQLPSSDFHDVTSGNNGGHFATAGYDLVTGRGSPEANLVMAGLVGGSTGTPTPPPPAPRPPQVVTPAHAGVTTVTGTTTTLGVTGTDAAGAASLTYTWSVVSQPAGIITPGFTSNGNNAAQNTTVIFHAAGTYTFLVTLKDRAGLTATSSVRVTVNQTQSYLLLTPGSASLLDGQAKQFGVTAEDQFAHVMARSAAWSWSVIAGAGHVSNTGLYTAPTSGNGAAAIRVTGGGMSVSATVSYTAPVPAAPSNVTAAAVANGWILVRWNKSSNKATGFIIQRSANNGVTWSNAGAVGANVNFFDDTAAARTGTYRYRVYAYNAYGASALSAPTAGVKPAAATAVKAATATVRAPGRTTFAASPAAGFLPAGASVNAYAPRAANANAAGVAASPAVHVASAAADAFWKAFGEASGRDWVGLSSF